MSTASFEERIAALEKQYAQLLEMVQKEPPKNAWREVVGMFSDSLQIEELHQETKRIRENDRATTRDADPDES